jgi:hypothetical protein
MAYGSLAEILADPDLELTGVNPTPAAIKEAIEDQLRDMQVDTVDETPDRYRRLVAARQAVDDLAVSGIGKAELVPMPSKVLERLLDMVERTTTAPPASSATVPVAELMQEHRMTSVAQASKDFTRQRTLPLSGIGALAAAVWGSRAAFGADLSHVGTVYWGAGAGTVMLLSAMALLLARQVQREDDWRLRMLYDPDFQADALDLLEDHREIPRDEPQAFSRRDYRRALYRALRGYRERGRSTLRAPLSTVDLEGALDDAAELALRRFIEMGTLRVVHSAGREGFLLADE